MNDPFICNSLSCNNCKNFDECRQKVLNHWPVLTNDEKTEIQKKGGSIDFEDNYHPSYTK